MIRFVVNRLLALVAVLLVLTGTLFLLRRATPGDPAKQILGASASPEALAAKRHELWLDRSLPTQYFHYIDRLLHGDLGISIRTRRPVSEDVLQYLPASLTLLVLALTLAVVVGLTVGALAGRGVRGTSVLNNALIGLASVPPFLLGLVAVVIFYAQLSWLPASGQTAAFDVPQSPTGVVFIDSLLAGDFALAGDAALHLVLPVTVLALTPAVAVARVFRSSLTDTMDSDYIRTARSKGLGEWRILSRHGIRNSIGSTLSMIGLQVGGIFASLAVVEVIFGWPGVGAYVAQSIPSGDFPGIAGVTLVVGVGYVTVNAIIDVLQAAADPRIRI
jgi:peptide/nickel transport system permease protein